MNKRKYTIGEEVIHIISHSIGILLSIIGLILGIIHAHTSLGIITIILYCIIMLYYFIISCIAHSINLKNHTTNSLYQLDNANQILTVAGTYTPITLCKLSNQINWIIFLVIWTVAILLIVLNINNINKKPKRTLLLNLIFYWIIPIYIIKTIPNLPTTAIELLIGGSFLYTIGNLFMNLKHNYKNNHAIFHIYTLISTILQYIFIYNYII